MAKIKNPKKTEQVIIKKMTVRMNSDLHKKLKHYAIDQDKSMDLIINELIEKHLNELDE